MTRRWKSISLIVFLCFISLAALTACGGGYKVGDMYKRQGVVVAVDGQGMPTMLLALDEQANLDADSAQRWAATLEQGWQLPSHDQWEQIRKQRTLINRTLADKGLPLVAKGQTYYWSSTPCSATHYYACSPDGIRCFFHSNKSNSYRCRAVYVFE